ncbi:MAG TPA: Na+/H+ antiporter subunit B [Prolixibacteraceae bacterium]|nr:Na+/H+ antiporter subunit B [Prolixibacteraceae bacterium]HPR59725.1 Na+/H+ antiporter subunit B [Prolixibacteraceae bacterium]
MKTVILSTTVKLLMPLFFLFSVFLLFRGHNLPGGGFIGGLMAAIAFFLHSMVFGVNVTKRTYRLNPVRIMALGLILALVAVIIPLFVGLPLFTGMWAGFSMPLIGKPGTPLLFDVGVYFVVIGVVLNITFVLTKY